MFAFAYSSLIVLK